MQTRRAILPDAPRIYELISQYSDDGTLLPRTQQDIFENVRDFVVVEDKGRVVGCAALHFYGLSLAEVRSVAVDVEYHGRHAGSTLIKGLMAEAKYPQGPARVPVYARARVLRTHGIHSGSTRSVARESS